MMDFQPKTVVFYINHYLSEGLEGLVPLKQSGRPPTHDVDFTGRFNWSPKLAAFWVKEKFDIAYQESSILQQLHPLGLSYIMPTYTLAKADPIKYRQFQDVLESQNKF